MRPALVALVILLPLLASGAELHPLPLPSPDGKPLASAPDQRTFHVPLRFERVEKFFRDRFGGDSHVALKLSVKDAKKTLTLVSHRKDDAWTKAVVKESEVGTTVEVTPVQTFEAEAVQGRGRPLVEIFLSRNEEAAKAADQIDHMQRDDR